VLKLLKALLGSDMLQRAMDQAEKMHQLLKKVSPPQPRTRSHAGRHYPRHSTNGQGHFAYVSGEGKRECARRVRQENRRLSGVEDWIHN
jgi:hypothetical protein